MRVRVCVCVVCADQTINSRGFKYKHITIQRFFFYILSGETNSGTLPTELSLQPFRAYAVLVFVCLSRRVVG